MSKLQIRTLSVTEIEKNGIDTIYVLNNTKGAEKGNVLFEVPKLSGAGTDAVLVHSTYIPVCLTDQVSKEQIVKSSEFRKAINSRRLTIIHSDDAIALLDTKTAKKELERIFKDSETFRNTVMSLDDSSVTTNEEMSKGMSDLVNGANDTDKINPSILQLVVDLEESKDEDSAINTLRNIDDLKRRDYRYVYKNVSSKHKELIRYCKDNAEQLSKKK
jgi:hypothetical protein